MRVCAQYTKLACKGTTNFSNVQDFYRKNIVCARISSVFRIIFVKFPKIWNRDLHMWKIIRNFAAVMNHAGGVRAGKPAKRSLWWSIADIIKGVYWRLFWQFWNLVNFPNPKQEGAINVLWMCMNYAYGVLYISAWTLLFILVGTVYQSLKLENKRG